MTPRSQPEPDCADCGRRLTASYEERESGLCLRCLNGPPTTREVEPAPPLVGPGSTEAGREAARRIWEQHRRESK